MAIPVGLMSPTAMMNQRTGGNPNQGYWQGDRFVFPKYKPKPPPSLMSPDVAIAVQAVQDSAKKAQDMAQQQAMHYGDGPQGEGFGGGRESVAPGNNPSFNESGHVNAPDQNANVSGMLGNPAPTNPAGLPSLPSFQEQATAPAAPTPGLAPSSGLQDPAEAPGLDPDSAPSGGKAGKSGMSGQQAANQAATQAATANTAAAIAAVDKAYQQNPASFMDAVKSAMQTTAQGIGLGVSEGISPSDTSTGAPGGFAPGHDKESKDYGGGTDTNNGTDSGASGKSGGSGDDGGLGAWRAGGRTGNDGDRRKNERRGGAHEDEFYLNPEMTSLMDSKAPGFLDALDQFQKGLMTPPKGKKPARGLMSR